MIVGRYQSLDQKTEVPEYRKEQISEERMRRPLYGMGKHIVGNKHPGQYRGGHQCSKFDPKLAN